MVFFIVAPCIDNIKFFICPTNGHKLYEIIIEIFRIITVAPTFFGLHKPSSWSYSLCLAAYAAMTLNTSLTTCTLEPEMRF